jgi:hypothetical protein
VSIVVALQNAMVGNGTRQPVVIRRGEAWDADDPIVTANPSLFSAEPTSARTTVQRAREQVVEQSTRAPGEKSRARRVQG